MTVWAALLFGWLASLVGVVLSAVFGGGLFAAAATGFVCFYVGFGWMLWVRTAANKDGI